MADHSPTTWIDYPQLPLEFLSNCRSLWAAIYLCTGVRKAMRIQYWLACFLLLSISVLCETKRSMVPQTVEFPSGKVRLKAYLWKPVGPGSFPAVLFSHGSGGNQAELTAGMQITESADILAPFFIKHGYVFLYPFRRGHGPSADQAPFMQDVLRQEEKERGREAANTCSSSS
jgi:predicted dienelactone hydrolase